MRAHLGKLGIAVVAVLLMFAALWLWSLRKGTDTERSISYLLEVQKYRDGKPYEDPYKVASPDLVFESGYRIRLSLSSPQRGLLYVLNQPPVSASKRPRYLLVDLVDSRERELVTDIPSGSWFEFGDERGTERLWLVWASHPVDEFEAVKAVMNSRDKGEIVDPDRLTAIQRFLEGHVSRHEKNRQVTSERTHVNVRGDVLVHAIDLEHR